MTRIVPLLRIAALPLAALLVVTGCGGDTDGAGSGSSTGGSAGSGAASSGGTGGGATGGSGGAAGGSGGATGGSGGATGGSGGATGGSGGSGGVFCGSAACGGGQYCCEPNCVANSAPCSGFALHCDDAGDCPGTFCCAAPPAGGGFPVADCKASCDADGEMIVCRWADPTSCPVGMQCQITAKLPAEYGFCQ